MEACLDRSRKTLDNPPYLVWKDGRFFLYNNKGKNPYEELSLDKLVNDYFYREWCLNKKTLDMVKIYLKLLEG